MDKRQWQKAESMLDQVLSIPNYKERKEFIQERAENEKLQKNVLEWLRAIQEADDVGFMEERF